MSFSEKPYKGMQDKRELYDQMAAKPFIESLYRK